MVADPVAAAGVESVLEAQIKATGADQPGACCQDQRGQQEIQYQNDMAAPVNRHTVCIINRVGGQSELQGSVLQAPVV